MAGIRRGAGAAVAGRRGGGAFCAGRPLSAQPAPQQTAGRHGVRRKAPLSFHEFTPARGMITEERRLKAATASASSVLVGLHRADQALSDRCLCLLLKNSRDSVYRGRPFTTSWRCTMTIKASLVATVAASFIGFFALVQPASAAPRHTSASTPAATELRAAMRKLWEDHITYARNYIISELADLPDKDGVAKRLLRNQDEIGHAIKPFYGGNASERLASLLRDHILIATEVW